MTLNECAKRMDSKGASGGSTFISWSEELPGPCDVCATLLAAVWVVDDCCVAEDVWSLSVSPSKHETLRSTPCLATSSCNTV